MEYSADENSSNKRLDQYVSLLGIGISRAQAHKLIENQNVLVNGKQAKQSYKIKLHDKISVNVPSPVKYEATPENIPLDIIYEDSDIIVVNKKRGMVVHPAAGNYSKTLVNALLFHCKDLSGVGGVLRPGIVHRLDKDTSGVIVAAKNDKAHKSLSRQFKDHTIKKTYLALVKGRLKDKQGTIDEPIGRHPVSRKKMAVILSRESRVASHKSRNAITHYKVLETFKNYSLIELDLETGRTHQIRVHMNHIGHPIAGDLTYGGKSDFGINQQLLHAQKIRFIHPTTKKVVEFEAPIPEDFKKAIGSAKTS